MRPPVSVIGASCFGFASNFAFRYSSFRPDRHLRFRTSSVVDLLLICVFCTIGRAGLTGACAKVNVTPPLGITLIGSKGQPSDAVMDDLYAKAMVLSDGRNTIAIVSADLLYTPLEEVTNPVRAAVSEKTGIPRSNIMVCATHTHSGPEVFTRSKLAPETRVPVSPIARSYHEVLIGKMADSAVIAYQNMQEVRIGASMGALPEVVFNRRPTADDGQVKMAFTLPPEIAATRTIEACEDGVTRATFTFAAEEAPLRFGPIDPRVLALRMDDANGRVLGALVGFGCHPVCIYPHLSTTVSADYPAFATRVVEQVEGGTTLFALGLAGNAVPLQRGPGPCAQIGKALGAEVLKRLQLTATSGEVELKALIREISLPVKEPASAEGQADDGTTDPMTTEIQALRLGDVYLLGLPGEVLVEVGLAIRRGTDIENLFIVTLANDAIGYVCDRQAYEQGGYEPGSATRLAPGAAEMMVERALALLDEISGDL